MNKEEILEFSYQNLDTQKGLMVYCKMADTYNLKKGTHSKPKNYVMNALYSSDIQSVDRDIFMFLYDMLAQQKYIADFQINNTELAKIFNKDKSNIGKSIQRLLETNLLIKHRNIYGYDGYIVNENINLWNTEIDKSRLSIIELKRKHLAGSNKYLTDEFKDYIKIQQLVV